MNVEIEFLEWVHPKAGITKVQMEGGKPLVLKAKIKHEWVGLTGEEIKAFDTWHDNREEEVGWCNPSEIVAYIESKLKDKNT